MDRLRQYRMLWPEGDDDLLCHGLSPLVTVTGGWLNGNFTAVRNRVPLKSMFMPPDLNAEEVVHLVLVDERVPVHTGDARTSVSPVMDIRIFSKW